MTPNDRTRFDALVEGANQEHRTPARVCGTASDVKPREHTGRFDDFLSASGRPADGKDLDRGREGLEGI